MSGRDMSMALVSSPSLQKLQTLTLSDCNISGPLVDSLDLQLQSLSNLDLGHNDLQRVPKFVENLTSLTILKLSSCGLQGNFPWSIFLLPKLVILNVSDNVHLAVTLPPGNLTRSVNIRDLQLASFKELSVGLLMPSKPPPQPPIDLRANKMKEAIVSSCRSSRVSIRNSSTNNPPGLIPEGQLQHLDLSGNNMGGKVPSCLWSITGLESLILDHNKLDGFLEPANFITRVIGSQLFFLTASNNQISGSIPLFLCNFIVESSILDMSTNALTGAIPNCLCKATRLKLRKNQLQGHIPIGFNDMELLDLNGNNLIGKIPKSLSNCTSLEALDLGNNELEDTFPNWLSQLSKLKVLVLRSNHFYGPIPAFGSLHSFPALKILDISSNHFSGNLPRELFKGLEAMKSKALGGEDVFSREYGVHVSEVFSYIYHLHCQVEERIKGKIYSITSSTWPFNNIIEVSNNNFFGEIPIEIGMLNYLRGFNVSDNHLNGFIPNSFGNLLQLEWLELSQNQLTGTIPEGLADLTFLSILNLSYNDLQGRIPQEKQFSTFDSSCFKGNPKLCGPQIKRACPTKTNGHNDNMSKQEEETGVWMYGLVGIGFAVGLMTITLPLVFMESIQNWCWDQTDKMIQFIGIKMQIRHSKFGTHRIP
ncbi:receptor-like protein 49 [Nymphaea colorata]|uniref:receptor-like protein 49 n=1 Tax=Nymphaea colorata TaxID=210225 RepID=UPI00129DE8D3|nr:receptor-like protein 49 [Nymphaea colorata]